MKGSFLLLVLAVALLAAGICLDGLPGIAICAAANGCSLTVVVREARRCRELDKEDHQQ